MAADEDWWESLTHDEVRDLLAQAIAIAPELEAPLRAAQRARSGELDDARALVDEVLRTRRHLDWRQVREYAAEARPVLEVLDRLTETHPTPELVELLQKALGHVLKVLHRADDDGLIGGVFDELLDMHARACARCLPDQKRLAAWLVKATYDDDWYSPPDPVPYASALGASGLATYRKAAWRALDSPEANDPYSTAGVHGRYAVQRIAVIDRDPEAVVASFAHIDRGSYRELAIAQAMREIGRDDRALQHARTGLTLAHEFDRPSLVRLIAAILVDAGDSAALIELRRSEHARRPSRSTYAALREASTSTGSWDTERPSAIVVLGRHDVAELAVVLLEEGRTDEAWRTWSAAEGTTLREKDLLALLKARAVEHPEDVVDHYLALADVHLVESNRQEYEQAVRMLKRAAEAAARSGRGDDVRDRVALLREKHRRRPAFIETLDRARLD